MKQYQLTPLYIAISSLLFSYTPGIRAQVIADPAAPGNQQPTILQAPNGTPLVNIQTPSAAGVSRNTYQQFDVQQQGVILNNSRTNVQSQLGGWVQGNPWLNQGEARVILNEVNSNHPSHLGGYVEVAGRRAEVIIANPAGIQVDGGGFINASRATLTTGTPVLQNGHLEFYRVQDGLISINGHGLDVSQTDYAQLLAHAIEVNAGIWAQDLRLVTGSNEIRHTDASINYQLPVSGLQTANGFALDVAHLGGMYAGKITLTGTSAGLGVRHAGQMGANAGSITITLDGQLLNTGDIYAENQLQLIAGELQNQGTIDSDLTHLQVNRLDNLGTGRIYGDTLAIGAHTLNNLPFTQEGEDTTIAATLAARERMALGVHTLNNREGALIYSAGNMDIGGALNGELQVTGEAGLIHNASATIEAANHLSLAAEQLLNSNEHFAIEQVQTVAPHRITYIQPKGSSHKIPLDELYWQSWSRAGQYRYRTDPPDDESGILGASAIPRVGEQDCIGEDDDTAVCTTISGAEYLPDNPAWAYFNIPAPTVAPARPELSEPVAPNPQGAEICIQQPDTQACASYTLALAQYQQEQQTYQAVLADYQQAVTQWQQESEALYERLDARIASYNQRFASRKIRDWTQYKVTRTEWEDQVVSSAPAQIIAGGNMTLNSSDTLLNDKSHILAGGSLSGDLHTLVNQDGIGQHIVREVGTSQYTYSRWRGGVKRYHQRRRDDILAYRPADRVQSINLSVVRQQSGMGHLDSNALLPTASLYSQNPDPTASYLIETDPRFTNYREWMSSDYLLEKLQYDGDLTQKRLGDGFYEQRLIREQINQLTGRNFLANHTDEEAQYQALMNAGILFAQQHQLIPGVALTDEQMAQLTSDIVWLVEQEVTLADGSTQQVLVPQVYARVREGDLDGTGTLIAAESIQLRLQGDLTNSATLAGQQLAVHANNIHNLGGRLQGSNLQLTAVEDINHVGGIINASNSLYLGAGRDVSIASSTYSHSNQAGLSSFSRTGLDQLAGIHLGEAAQGGLQISAGRDLNINAAQIINQSDSITALQAGQDIHLGTLQVSVSENTIRNENNRLQHTSTQDIGSQLVTQGDILLQAGQDIITRAASLESSQGQLLAVAGRHIDLGAGEQTEQFEEARQHTHSSTFSNRRRTSLDGFDASTALGTSLSAQSMTLMAGEDVTLTASDLVATGDVNLVAGGNMTIAAGENTHSEYHYREDKRSGLLSSGLSLTLGTQGIGTTQQSTHTTAAGSTLGSLEGDINLQAEYQYNQAGSDLIALAGDIHVQAQDIAITEARETSSYSEQTRFRQSGISLALKSPVIDAFQNAEEMYQAAQNTSSSRMQALAAGSTALNLYNNADILSGAVQALAGGNASEAVSLSLTVGGSSSRSQMEQQHDIARGSSLAATGDINLIATGAGEASNLLVQGSQINAGNNVTLAADNQVNLRAAQNTASQDSDNKSSSAGVGIGITLGADGFAGGITVNASAARGNADGEDLYHTNSQVNAGQTLTLQSGGDTNLIGAVARGEQVIADIGGNLSIQSLQDTSTYDSNNQSLGGSGTFGMGGGFNANYNQSDIEASYASVEQQSGLHAGDGGFQITTGGDTRLIGAVITSSDDAVTNNLNTLDTASIHTQDIYNHMQFEAEAFSVGTSSAGYADEGDSQNSVTQSGISGLAGNSAVRTGDGYTGLQNTFDASSMQREMDAQVAITAEFGRESSNAWGTYANQKSAELKVEAWRETDPQRRQALLDEADKWSEGGAYHLAGHTLLGTLSGDISSALGNSTSVAVMSELGSRIDELNLPDAVKSGLNASLAAGIGYTTGGRQGAAQGYTSELNNRQLHDQEIALIKASSRLFAESLGISPEEAEARLLVAANSQTDRAYAQEHAQPDEAAQNFLRSISQMMNLDGEMMLAFAPMGYYDDSSKFADQTGYEAERELLANQPLSPQSERNWQLVQEASETIVQGGLRGTGNLVLDAIFGLPETGAAIFGLDWQGPRIEYRNEVEAQVGQDVGTVVAGTTGAWGLFRLGSKIPDATTVSSGNSVDTPYGPAIQSGNHDAQGALQNIQSGAPVYRQGEFGVQNTSNAQFWAIQNPLTTPNYASQMGMPGSLAPKIDWVMRGVVMPERQVITRPAPGLGTNTGGTIEAVTPPGGVQIQWFHMPE